MANFWTCLFFLPRLYETAACPVYAGKSVLFKMLKCSVKELPCPHLVEGCRPLLRLFKWVTVWFFLSQGTSKLPQSYRFRVTTLFLKSRLFRELFTLTSGKSDAPLSKTS